jgi:FtsH-binding integral membrane protein
MEPLMGFSLPVTSGLVRTGEERAQLVRRTYSLVFISVLVTVVGATYAMSNAWVMDQVIQHPWLTMLAVFVPLMAAQGARTRFPLNVAMVLLFAFAMGVMIGPTLIGKAGFDSGLVTQAATITVGAFGTLTLYAFASRRDFSAWGSFFVVGLWVLIATSLLNMFFGNATSSLWIAGGTVLIFSGLLVFDTWRLRNVYGPEDYVIAAVAIYLDLLNMFLAILRILGGGRRS